MLSAARIKLHVRNSLTIAFKRGVVTAKDMAITPVEAARLEKHTLLKRVSTRQTGQRGRPAIEYRLTDKARKRVKRVV